MKAWCITALLLPAVLAGGGAVDKPTDKPAAKPTDQKKNDGQKDAPPACMHCGAICGLKPICVCKPGTKKLPKVEFDVACEPFCIPGCGSHLWPRGGRGTRVGCAGCRQEHCACPGQVRFRNKLIAEKVDEEKPTIERTVAYVCRTCSGPGRVRCCDVDPPQPARDWWCLPRWWPWQPGHP